jgi:predicted N-acetyltransferase YhbS
MYGTAQLLPTGWYLRGIKVHPEWRRAGLARELTRRRLDWLSQKTKEVFVFLDDESKVSLPMYHEFGFKLVSKGWEFLSYEQKREDQRGILLSLGI